MLNNLGNVHARDGDYRTAEACYDAALGYNVSSVLAASNLFKLHVVWDRSDSEDRYRAADRWIDIQRRQMRELNISQAVERLPCDERDRFTGEKFSPRAWYGKAHLQYKDGKTAEAQATLQDLMDSYPSESCIYRDVLSEALVLAALMHCKSGDAGAAADAYRRSLSVTNWTRAHLREFQQLMADAGTYPYAIDGVFGSNSYTALAAWTEIGCPGIEIGE
jgi:tetratricopeptide (TPR) repeat protein